MSAADREREQYEALVAAYRQLPRPEPPPERDRTVLAAARAAVEGGRAPRSRWPALMGTAATLALAVGLAWQMREEDFRAPLPGSDGAATPSVAVPAPTGQTSSAAREAVAEPAPATPAPEREDRALEAPKKQSVEQDDSRQLRKQEAATEQESAAIEAPPPPPPPPPVLAPELQDAPAAAAPALEERKAMPAEPPREADSAGMSASEAELAQPFPQDASAPSQPPAAAPAPPAPRPAAPAAAGTGIAGPAPAKAAVAADSVQRERAEQSAQSRDPTAWLDEIRRLLRQGQRERAVDELEAFTTAFPDTPLPEDLRDLAP